MRRVLVSCFFLSLVVGPMVSCATNRGVPVDGDRLRVELVRTREAYVSSAKAYRDGDELVMYGAVRRHPGRAPRAPGGHVDILALDLLGRVVTVTQAAFVPRQVPAGPGQLSRFRARQPWNPDIVLVRLRFHRGIHEDR